MKNSPMLPLFFVHNVIKTLLRFYSCCIFALAFFCKRCMMIQERPIKSEPIIFIGLNL